MLLPALAVGAPLREFVRMSWRLAGTFG
jgi:hypothetical protein